MIAAIIQARLSSTRLPGKVMLPLAAAPMLARQIERVRCAKRLERIAVATSVDASDAPLVELCRQIGIECFRGSLADVLDRYYQAATSLGATTLVRLTGDCPLVDPEVIDRVIAAYHDRGADYASNTLTPTYPDGLDVEVFRASVLAEAWREAGLTSQREHVTPFIWGNPERFRLVGVRQDEDRSDLRWTVDTQRDYEFVSRVYDALYPANPRFSTDDVLSLLARNPALQELNADQMRNEGYEKSLREDHLEGGRR